MFDVSFSELMVIAVIALIVIGPEKLPKVARTLGALTGRMQRYVAQVKEEVNREVRFEELQQLQQEIQETVTKTEATLQRKADVLTRELDFQETDVQGVTVEDKNVANKTISEATAEDSQKPVIKTLEVKIPK
ncbi:MAG: Sec-independent protein translocase protein TatB [Methylotenera sp.]